MPPATYILPIKRAQTEDLRELTAYLHWLNTRTELLIVDGSEPPVFEHHLGIWDGLRHVAPDPELRTLNGKVWGVLTGLALASNERVVIADDDVRYDAESLARVLNLLDYAAVVRPQNYFSPLPWHAAWDTSRSLLNRLWGGDWPGTLAVRRSALQGAGGYDGDCLFENLELVRTVRAAGGIEAVPLDLFVRRLPAEGSRFLSQRVRQAYDEFARPGRLALQLALLPGSLLFLRRPRRALAATALAIGLAEAGRRRAGGQRVFPWFTSLFAPLWLAERSICSWLALFSRLRSGGVRYSGGVIAKAANSESAIRARITRRRATISEEMALEQAAFGG